MKSIYSKFVNQNLLEARYLVKSFTVKNKFFKHMAVLVFWIAVWQTAYKIVNQDIFLISPFSVAQRIFVLSGDINFWKYIVFSLMRVVLGFLSAIIMGTSLAVLMNFYNLLFCIFKPLILIIKTIPVASFVVLALVFIKSFYLPIFISFLMVMPLVWANVFEGMNKVDTKLLQMSKVYQFSKKKKIMHIYVPSLKPYFLAAATTGIGFAWKSAIAAEIIANTANSVGAQILNAKAYMETLDVFAWTAVIIFLSFVLEKILIIVLKNI